jgi:hypothetical protein
VTSAVLAAMIAFEGVARTGPGETPTIVLPIGGEVMRRP